MASSQVMSSTSPANPDLPRRSTAADNHPLAPAPDAPLYHRHPFHLHNSDHAISAEFGSMNVDEILKNMYSDPAGAEPSGKNAAGKTVDEVWKDIISGGPEPAPANKEPRMTLEDFLSKAGAVPEEDVRGHPVPAVPQGYPMEPMMNAGGVQFPASPIPVVHMQNGPGNFGMEAHMGYGNAMVPVPPPPPAEPVRAGNGRGKRRAPPVDDVVLDKATQQKQRRMIKNRESAARSRERKQAYNLELESLVTQHEEENARLLKEMAEDKKQRYNQLMKCLIPVVEKRRPPQPLPLRRVQSMSW